MLNLLLITTLVLGSCLSEAPLNNAAPYAAAGYRPSIPFDLPGEYNPNYDVDTEQQLPNTQGFNFEITKQRVDFAGQEIQRIPISEPQNQYLTPEEIVFIGNSVGNNNRKPQYFGYEHNHRRHHVNAPDNRPNYRPVNTPNDRPDNRPAQRPSTERPQFTTNLTPINIPLPNPTTDERFESQQFFPKEQQQSPALQYGAPNINIDPRNFEQPASQYDAPNYNGNQQQQLQQPSRQYGAPTNNFETSNLGQQKPALQYGAPNTEAQTLNQEQQEEELQKQYALDVLNAAVQNYNRLQENQDDKIAQGQYFVVNPDHSIQKVKFTTKKSKDETKQNDFTATLQYTKVGEINDPLYKYTAEGQLVRIVKK